MRVFDQANCCIRSGAIACHFAISGHRLSSRLSSDTEVAPTLGNSRVIRKFHANQASSVVLPGPLEATKAIRFVCGKACRPSSCHGSGSARNSSRTIWSGCQRQRASVRMVSASGALRLFTDVTVCGGAAYILGWFVDGRVDSLDTQACKDARNALSVSAASVALHVDYSLLGSPDPDATG